MSPGSGALRSIAGATLAVLLTLLARPELRAAPLPDASSLGKVTYISGGLTVRPPGKSGEAGKVKMALFQQYALGTKSGQRASVGFSDGTTLHFNQNTEAVLTDPHTTDIRHGEIAQYLVPGTDHQVRTAAAVASAIGTAFDVATNGRSTVFVVLYGALQVQNSAGMVVVKSNHASTVLVGAAPAQPVPIDAQAVFAWTAGLPTPDLGEDVALDANGGAIADFSSQRESSGDIGHATHINDGLLSTGWESADGRVANEWVKLGFFGGSTYRVTSVIIDPAATYGDPASEDLRDFSILVSSTDTADSSFTTVLRGTCKQNSVLQHFELPAPVLARYVKLVVGDNYGSAQRVAVAEFEIVATATLFNDPTAIAVGRHGFTYVADTLNDRIVELSPNGHQVKVWGTHGVQPGQFEQPRGLALDHQGNLWVADSNNHRIQKFSSSGQFRADWGQFGVMPGDFQFPVGIAVDRQNDVFVVDRILHRVEKFSPDGRLLATFGHAALTLPHGIAIAKSGVVFVADSARRQVVAFSSNGKQLRAFGHFRQPFDVAIGDANVLYVTDFLSDHVVKLTFNGRVLKRWGGFGESPGQFRRPSGVSVDRAGKVYVADAINGRIEKFSADGKFLARWGKRGAAAQELAAPGGIAVDTLGNTYLTDSFNDRIQVRTADGVVKQVDGYHGEALLTPASDLGRFWNPHGIVIDQHGAIFVVDSSNRRIQELAPRGPIRAFALPATGAHQPSLPFAVAIDSMGNLYVTDQTASHILKLSSSGRLLATIGHAGSALGQLDEPQGIAVDAHGVLYVADAKNRRVETFSTAGRALRTWNVALSKSGKPLTPKGLALDAAGNVYICGHFIGVREFSPAGTLVATFTDSLPDNPFTRYNAVTVDTSDNVYATSFTGATITKFDPGGTVVARWGNPAIATS